MNIRAENITFDDLDEILFGSDEDSIQDEIPEDVFDELMEVANV